MPSITTHCPCHSGKSYIACCGQYIERDKAAPTPETLMRSRYTAYTKANIDYIVRTQRSPAADNFNVQKAKQWASEVKWLGLNVMRHWFDKKNPSIGFVEFTAVYFQEGGIQELREVSEFMKSEGRWYYVRGV